MLITEKKDAYPLQWPTGWPRTRPQDRRPMASWKRSATQYRDALIDELDRMKSPGSVISCNVQVSMRGSMTAGIEPLDTGVAVYFSRPGKEDFAWQEVLGVHDPAPTEDQIQTAYRKLAVQYHPDKGGDLQMFQLITKHRDQALRYIQRRSGHVFDHVIACDAFKEVRLNLAAVVQTLKAIRQIERCGTTSLMERAFAGFSALPEHASATSEGR